MAKLFKSEYIPVAVLLGFVAVLLFSGFFPNSASAKDYNYGPWVSGSKNSAEGWQADVDPWNSSDTESFNSGCVINGRPLSDTSRGMLTQVLQAAGLVYNNGFNIEATGSIPIEDPDKLKEGEEGRGVKEENYFEVNGGYPSGPTGYRQFIRDEKKLLRKSIWIPYEKRTVAGDGGSQIGDSDYQVPSGTWVAATIGKNGELLVKKGGIGGIIAGAGAGAVAGLVVGANPFSAVIGGLGGAGAAAAYQIFWGNEAEKVDISKQQKSLAGFIPNSNNPLEAAFKLPVGCTLPLLKQQDADPNEILSNPISYFTNVIVGLIDIPVDLVYGLVKDRAWQWTFMTPHTERGDLIWQLPDNCVADSSKQNADSSISDACQGGKFLGFSKERTTIKKQTAPFLSMGHFAQWLISGFYFIIFFTAILFFIVRGTKSRTLNVMTILPRLLLSIVLTFFAVFIIGAIISFANFLVLAILGASSSWDVGAINVMLSQPDLVMGGIGGNGADILRLITKILSTYFYVIFVAAALVRQIALIIVVVLAPVAIFCIINPSWQPHFNKWLRTLLAVCFIPVVLAFILKLCLVANPAIESPASTYGSTGLGLFSVLMLMLTLWVMARVIRSSRNFIIGQSSMATGAMGSLGGKLSRWGDNHNNPIGKLARRAGGNLSTASGNAEALGSMVPPDKVLGGAMGGLAAAGGGGAVGAARAALGGQITPTNSSVPGQLAAWQAGRQAASEERNSLIETTNYRAFNAAQQTLKDGVAKIQSDAQMVDPSRRGQWMTGQRDALISSVMASGLGGLPVKQGGRHYVETNPTKIRERLNKDLGISHSDTPNPTGSPEPAPEPEQPSLFDDNYYGGENFDDEGQGRLF